MNKNIFFVSLSFFLFSISNLHAKTSPSFDCDKASNKAEKLICSSNAFSNDSLRLNCSNVKTNIETLTCSDDELLDLNTEMMEIYTDKYSNIKNSDIKEKFKKKQEDWINTQEKSDYMKLGAYTRRVFYLKEAYTNRIVELNNFKL